MERKKLGKSKLEAPYGWKQRETGRVSLIVRVNKANYVPDELKVRSRIDPYLFTADAPSMDAVDQLQRNKSVVSISFNRPLPAIE